MGGARGGARALGSRKRTAAVVHRGIDCAKLPHSGSSESGIGLTKQLMFTAPSPYSLRHCDTHMRCARPGSPSLPIRADHAVDARKGPTLLRGGGLVCRTICMFDVRCLSGGCGELGFLGGDKAQ